jgi:hypothetical protein
MERETVNEPAADWKDSFDCLCVPCKNYNSFGQAIMAGKFS